VSQRTFQDRSIRIVLFDDVASGERVIEFRDPELLATGSHIAVIIPDGEPWERALVSINPEVAQVPADLLLWAIETAHSMIN